MKNSKRSRNQEKETQKHTKKQENTRESPVEAYGATEHSLFPDPESQIVSESSHIPVDTYQDTGTFLTHLDEVLGPLDTGRHQRVQEKILTQWPYV